MTFNRVSQTPGPGAYEYRDDTETRSTRSHNVIVAKGQGTFMSSQWDDRDSASNLRGEGVDPGTYADHHFEQMTMVAKCGQSRNALVREGKISFESKIARCDASAYPDSTPLAIGPGKYSFEHLYACGEPKASPQMTSSFRSKIPMGQHVRAIHTPGPGEYQEGEGSLREPRSFSKLGSSSFAGGSARCAEMIATSTSNTAISPVTYPQDHHSIQRLLKGFNPRLPAFASSSRRGDPTDWC